MFERNWTYREDALTDISEQGKYDVILFGLGRFGSGIADRLWQQGYRVLGVDFDPDLLRIQDTKDYEVRYGDAEDPEFLSTLPLDQVRWVVSSVRELPINLALLHGLQEQGFNGQTAVTSDNKRNAEQLKNAGADQVLIPYASAAAEAANTLFAEDNQTVSAQADLNHQRPE